MAVISWLHIPRVSTNSLGAIFYLASDSFSAKSLEEGITVWGSTAVKITAISVCVVVVLVGGLQMVTSGYKDEKRI